ncbi:hypothetical protein M5689_015356 [Euphorbia peplus]|nr:hypothetical protein M5689_015356 [Euphorbia peplus]
MRIRKRKIPFPLSSLSPVPLSDPPFSTILQPHPTRDDKQLNLPLNSSGCISKNQEQQKQEDKLGRDHDVVVDDDDDQNGGEGGNISNDNRSSGAKTPTSILEDGKKRGSLETKGEVTMSMMNEVEKDKKIMKGKDVKKRGRGGALMEGSRCSRVNGRGWRCCQPTLVGYSLCEHHLGKGRLRSMASVRNRSAPKKGVERDEKVVVDVVPGSGDDGEEAKVQVQKQPLLVSKRKHKLGMVKARSISSLLGQANNIAEADQE